jgi:1,4-dihydroxy-2-naphthoate octaprenyltransferase
LPERSRARNLVRATRAKALPLIIVPVLVGSALAPAIDWARFALVVAGSSFAHLAAMVANDVFDEQCDRIAGMDRTAIVTATGLIQTGVMSARAMSMLAVALGIGALGCGVPLVVAHPGVAWFMLGGAFLGWAYSGPPFRYGYRGRGLGELGQVGAFGVLPVAGALYAQTGAFDIDAMWIGLVPGFLTMLVFFHHNLLHHRSDKAVGKMTPAALLGPEAALLVGVALIGLSYASLAVVVAVGILPVLALIGLLPSVQLFAAWTRAFRDPAPQPLLQLLGASLGASVLTGTWLAISLAFA